MKAGQEGRWKPLLGLWGVLAVILAFQGVFSGQILFKGQVIKQFHAYAISSSLAESGNPLRTALPCRSTTVHDGKQVWAEEPPLFHAWAAFLKRLGISDPALPAFLLSGVWVVVFLLLCAHRVHEWSHVGFAVIGLSSPVFMRYFSQHMPDLCAALLLPGVWWLLVRNRAREALALSVLAATIKILVLFPLTALWLCWAFKKDFKKYAARAVGAVLLSLLPFVLWVWLLKSQDVPNPFVTSSLMENRHSGSWSLLLDGVYWQRFVTWVILKGMGVGVFYLVLRRGVALCTHKLRTSSDEIFLWAWAIALVPYWILVRQGNFVHDYYFLPFFFPFAWLSALEWNRLVGWSRWALLLLCCVGYLQPLSLEKHRHRGDQAPSFCGQEAGLPL